MSSRDIVTTGARTPVRFAKPQRVAFVQSSWHQDVVGGCWDAFSAEIEACGILLAQVDRFEVPGAFEIPLHVQTLAKTRRYTALVAAGLVVDSGLHGYVAETVIKALMDVQLRTEVPVFSAISTPQALPRPRSSSPSSASISSARDAKWRRPAPIPWRASSGCAARLPPASCEPRRCYSKSRHPKAGRP